MTPLIIAGVALLLMHKDPASSSADKVPEYLAPNPPSSPPNRVQPVLAPVPLASSPGVAAGATVGPGYAPRPKGGTDTPPIISGGGVSAPTIDTAPVLVGGIDWLGLPQHLLS